MDNSNFPLFIATIDKNTTSFDKSKQTLEFLLKQQSCIYRHVLDKKEGHDEDNNWDIEENFIQFYNEMYELFKRFLEIEYIEKPIKLKGKEQEINLEANALFGDTSFITPNVVKVYSKTFVLGLQELHKYVSIKPFDIFMILINVLSEEKLPNINKKQIKIKNKNYEATELKLLCCVMIKDLIVKFGYNDKKYQTLFPTLLTTIFKLLKFNKDTYSYFTINVLKLLKCCIEIDPLNKNLTNKFLKYFQNTLYQPSLNTLMERVNFDINLKVKNLLIDIYFVQLTSHKQMKDVKLIEEILRKLAFLKFDSDNSPQVANLISNSLLHYKSTNQLGPENILEIYSRLVTDNLDSRLGLVTAFQSLQIYLSYCFLNGDNGQEESSRFFSIFIKPFVDMTIPYIEINSRHDISSFNNLFTKTIFENIICKHLGKEEILSILNTIFSQSGFIIDDTNNLNFSLFYLDFAFRIIEFLRNDINDGILIDKIDKKLIKLATESKIFQIRVTSNIMLKSFYRYVGNGQNIKIKKLLEESFKFINKSFQLVDINEFQFHKAQGHALIISNLSSIILNENDFLLQILVTVVNFLKNTSTNLIINGKISFYKILVSWIIIIGILGNTDPATKDILSLQRNQLVLLWNNLFLSSNFGVSIEKEEELYKFLEVQYHSLTSLFNFIKNYHLNELELKQLSKYLIKLSNIRYSIKSKIIDKLLLQIELRVLEIYCFLVESYDIEFNNNSLLLLLIKNMSSVNMFEDNNKNILQELFNNEKNESYAVVIEPLKKILSSSDSYAYGLSSLITKDSIKWNDGTIVFKPWENNLNYWDYFLQSQICDPFSEDIYNDHLKILTSIESEVKSKNITTAIIDISIVLFTKVFEFLNPTIQLSILENLHANLISKNLIPDRLEVIHINALIALNKIIRDSNSIFVPDVANFIKTILETISVSLIDDYKIILLSESLAAINEQLGKPSINSESVLQKLTGNEMNEKYLAMMEFSNSLKANCSNDNVNEIYGLLADICHERSNKKTLQWGLISLNNALSGDFLSPTTITKKGLDEFVLNKIVDTILSVLLNEDDNYSIFEIIGDIWAKILHLANKEDIINSNNLDSVLLITYIILNQDTPTSFAAILKVVGPIDKLDFGALNKDLIKLICCKYMTSCFYTVLSNTDNNINLMGNDLFELTSVNTNFIHIIFDYFFLNEKYALSKGDLDYYVVMLLLLSFNDVLIIEKFKYFFGDIKKLPILLKVFRMNYNDMIKRVVNMEKSHLNFLQAKTSNTISTSKDNLKHVDSLSADFSTFIHFKETLLETIAIQLESNSVESKKLSKETIDSIIEICYDISLNFIKDNNLCELSLKLLNLALSSRQNSMELSNKQTSQINTILNLHYNNAFGSIDSIKLIFVLISTVIPLMNSNNKELITILVNGLSICTAQSNNNNDMIYFGKLKIQSASYSNLINELKVLILKSWAILGDENENRELHNYINELLPLWIIIIRDSLIRKVSEKSLSDQVFIIDDDLILIIKTVVSIIGNKKYALPEELTNDDILSLLYICYVSCISFIFTNVKSSEKITTALNIVEQLLLLNKDLNLFSSMNINKELHNEFITILSTIISHTSENDVHISKVLNNMYMALPFEDDNVDVIYDYLSLNIQILQKYLPVISTSEKDLYQQLDLNSYILIRDILLSLSSFIDKIDDFDMKLDLVVCVLNYIGNVVNKVENFNYYFPYVIQSLEKLLVINQDATKQFWKVVQKKIETDDPLLEDYYLALMSLFVKNIEDLPFNIDRFVDRLINTCNNKETITKSFELFNEPSFKSKNKNLLFKKCCKQLLLKLKGNSVDNLELLLFKFNLLFENNLTPGSYKLIFIFYSKLLIIKSDSEEIIKKSLLILFKNDLDHLTETITDYSTEGTDYSNLI
ncbi:hypothetical protein HANVADRAFT_60755 [Hanseniaspora valbyensis NRRL Y-1626]|uniref:AP-1 accessory protein LAA1 n=1 Tax=Hanseniaspora valbyensis NRRL Y-1626 TaxID=766949 RepID=A0A1B7TIW3_9ASCO|nr:hypothetical protein HANVADRAFT_60755 [Hanseniaspora valbyensis NRRL Y-1626]